VYLKNKAISAKSPFKQAVYHESFTGNQFPLAVPPSKLQKKNTIKDLRDLKALKKNLKSNE
jgi:hypothetical protein